MAASSTPDAIDSRLVFRAYAWLGVTSGLLVYAWGPMWLDSLHLPGLVFGRAAVLRSVGAVAVSFGLCAAGFARVDDPVGRRTALLWFAFAHIAAGLLLLGQWIAIFVLVLPPTAGWTVLAIGGVLLYLALTGPGTPAGRATMVRHDPNGVATRDVEMRLRSKPSVDALRSEYDERIRQVVRQEERARLARDLHDAVKQQLFVIQTAAATVQARFESDRDGARAALDQVREATREAMTEMEVMLDNLKAAPLENSGLIDTLRTQCEALGFRTGAEVTFSLGPMPPEEALSPGARESIHRAAQEALSNVARHARATTVRVTLGVERRHLVLTVEDNGRGCVPAPGGHGMGTANMAARARDVGGTFELSSRAGHGTTVMLSVPCAQRPARDYAIRAAAWSVVLAGGLAVVVSDAFTAAPWMLAVALVAAIAVARHLLAAYRVSRPAVRT